METLSPKPRKSRKAAPDPVNPEAAAPESDFSLSSGDGMVLRDDGAGAAAAREVKARLSVTLNADGSLDLGSMRDKSKEALKRALSDAAVLPALGLGMAHAAPDLLPAAAVAPLYAILGRIEALIAARVYKLPAERLQSIFAYTPAQLDMLCPPTARIVSKYGGMVLAKYQDEFTLALALLQCTQEQIAAVQQLAAAEAERLAKEKQVFAMAERERAEAPPVSLGVS